MDIVVGTREVMKMASEDKIAKIVVASNAPKNIKEKVFNLCKEKNIEFEEDGDEIKLATKVGKPFPVATVGYLKGEEEE